MSFENKYEKYQYKYLVLLNYQNGGDLNDIVYRQLQKLMSYFRIKK